MFRLAQQLLQPQFGEGRDRQQQKRIRHQVADADLQPVEVVGPVVPIGPH